MGRFLPSHQEGWQLALVLVTHLLLVQFALRMVTPEEHISLMWLPDGFLLGVFVLLRRSLWPLLIGLLASTVMPLEFATTDRPAGAIALFFSANVLESLGGAVVYLRWCGGRQGLRSMAELAIFILIAVILIPGISGLIGAGTVIGYGFSDDFLNVYRTWVSSAGLGILFVAPLIVEGGARWRSEHKLLWSREGEFILWIPIAIFGLTVFDGLITSADLAGGAVRTSSLIYIGLPLLCIAAARYGMWGGILASSVMVISAVQLTAMGYGPFSSIELSASESVFRLQTYLATAVIATLFTAVAVEALHIAQLALRQQIARFRTTFEHSPTALFEEDFSAVLEHLVEVGAPKDRSREWLSRHPGIVGRCAELVKVRDVNKRTLELFDAREKGDLRGGLVSAPSLDVFLDLIAAFYSGEVAYRGEAVQTTLAGDFIETSFDAVLIPGHEQNWSHVVVAISDITPMRRAIRQLERSQRRFRATFQTSAQAIALISTNGLFIDVNKSLAALLGYTPSELINRSYIDATHPDDRAHSIDKTNSLSKPGNEVYHLKKRCLHKNGNELWLDVEGHAIRDETGQLEAIIVMAKKLSGDSFASPDN